MVKPILVIGATGTVGREVVRELLRTGQVVRAASREPASGARNLGGSVEFVKLDFERPETFAPALTNIDRVFLIARPGDDAADRVAIPLIDEMKRQSVRSVVDLSAMGIETQDDAALRKIEHYLEDSGLGFTHLRPNWFMQVFTTGPLFAGIHATGTISIPAGTAKISYIDVRDIAAVAAAALTQPSHLSRAYTLTGEEALDHHQIADLISRAGCAVRYVPLSDAEARKNLETAGLGGQRADRLLGFYSLVRQGFCASVSPDVERILGRPPISFAAFAHDHAAVWR